MPPFEASAETPAGPSFGKCHLSRKPARRSSPRKPLSTRLRTRPFGPSFGTRHVSRRLSRKTPSKNALRTGSLLRCSRVPNPTPFSRMSCECATRPGAHAETLSGRLPGHPPSVFRTRQVSPSAPSGKSSRKPRMRCVPECRVRFPRMPPVAPRVPSEPEPQTSRMPPGSPRITPGRPSRALGECAACRSSRERTFCLL